MPSTKGTIVVVVSWTSVVSITSPSIRWSGISIVVGVVRLMDSTFHNENLLDGCQQTAEMFVNNEPMRLLYWAINGRRVRVEVTYVAGVCRL